MNSTAVIQQQDVHSVDAIVEHLAPSAPFFTLARGRGEGILARRNADQGSVRAFFEFIQRLCAEGYAPLLQASRVENGHKGSVVYRISDGDAGSFTELAIDVVKDGKEFYTASITAGKQEESESLSARGDNDSRLARNLYGKFFS
jgi:hypothetical protein